MNEELPSIETIGMMIVLVSFIGMMIVREDIFMLFMYVLIGIIMVFRKDIRKYLKLDKS